MHTSPNFQFSDIEAGGVEGGQQEGGQQENEDGLFLSPRPAVEPRHGKGFVFFSNDFKKSTKLKTNHNNQKPNTPFPNTLSLISRPYCTEKFVYVVAEEEDEDDL